MKPIGTIFASLLMSASFAQTTFNVDDVKMTKFPLQSNDFQVVIQNRLERPIFALPEGHANKQVSPSYINAFAYSIHTAFDEHRPLELSPDDVWLAICQGVGNHVAMNVDSLENKLLKEDRPDKIKVFIEDLAQDNTIGWEQLVQVFNDSLQRYLKGDGLAAINQNFSTTTPVISTAYQITLMDAVQTFFSFEGGSGCGIPSITLTGTTEDWQRIYDQVDQFNAYGLEFWTAELKPVLYEFVQASKGSPNVEFWQSMYKDESFYGVNVLSGWILKFFPYLERESNVEPEVYERAAEHKRYYYRNPYIYGKDYLLSEIATNDLPKGYVSVPFVWKEFRPASQDTLTHNLQLNAGFFGLEQEDFKVRPFISWCISDLKGENPEYIRWGKYFEDTNLVHDGQFWIPGIAKKADIQPIFDANVNNTTLTGWSAFKNLLKDNGFNDDGNSTLDFIVTWDGSTIFRNLEGPLKSKELELREYLSLLQVRWTPAKVISPEMYPVEEGAEVPCSLSLSIKL